MSDQNLKLQVDFVPRLFEQAKTIDSCAKDRDQIIVVGLDVAMQRRAIVTRCEWMNDAGVVLFFF